MVLEEARSEPWSRKLPQSDAGGSRHGTTAKEPVVKRIRDGTTAKRASGKKNQRPPKEPVVRKERKQHGYEDRGKSIPNSRGKSKEPTEHSQQQASQEHRRSGGRWERFKV